MSENASLSAIRRDIDALTLTLKNLADIQGIGNQKLDYIIEVLDKPPSEDNPLANALTQLARAVEQLDERVAVMTDELQARLPPRATH